MPTDAALRASLRKATEDAEAWFRSASTAKAREDYVARGKLGDDGTGAVYAYFNKSDSAVYVGTTNGDRNNKWGQTTISGR
jgi:hypothetical protein